MYREPTLTAPREPARSYRWPIHGAIRALTAPRGAARSYRWHVHGAITALLAAPVMALWYTALWPEPQPIHHGPPSGVHAGVDRAALVAVVLGAVWLLYTGITTTLVGYECRSARGVIAVHAVCLAIAASLLFLH